MRREFICVVCPAGCRLLWDDGAVSGYSCERGLNYAKGEMTSPKRNVSSTVVLSGSGSHRRLPVKTASPLPLGKIREAVRLLDGIEVKVPVERGEAVLKDILGSGVDFIAAKSVKE